MMDRDTWSNEEVKSALGDFIFVKIDIDKERELAAKYDVKAIPNIFFLDGNGAKITNFLGYMNSGSMKEALSKNAITTEFISNEMINYYKKPNYSNGLRLSYKYYEFTLYADKTLKTKLMKACDYYVEETRKSIKKKDENYIDKKQKMEFLELFDLAYSFKFEKLNKKISEYEMEGIKEANLYDYWFLKHLSSKGIGLDTSKFDELLKKGDMENVIVDSNEVYAFYQKSIENN